MSKLIVITKRGRQAHTDLHCRVCGKELGIGEQVESQQNSGARHRAKTVYTCLDCLEKQSKQGFLIFQPKRTKRYNRYRNPLIFSIQKGQSL